MSTWRELVYMVLDNEKISSDDSYITEDHIIYTLDKTRATLLKQAYKDIKTFSSEKNYQVIDISLHKEENCLKGDTFPMPLDVGKIRVYSSTANLDFFGEIPLVSKDRFKYVGSSKYLQNIIYGTIINTDQISLYLKSSNPQFFYLENVKLSAIFMSALEVHKYQKVPNELSEVNKYSHEYLLDSEFPLAEDLVPILIKAVVEVFHPIVYKPEDKKNNGNDDLSKVAISKAKQ